MRYKTRQIFRLVTVLSRPEPHPTLPADLFRDRKLAARTVRVLASAPRFLFVKDIEASLSSRADPVSQSDEVAAHHPQEVGRLIASAKNLMRRATLMTLYATGLRRPEL